MRTTDPLVQTKFLIPSLRTGLVSRPRLIDRLNDGLNGKLILVAAPAGYGKTTLVTEWLYSLISSPLSAPFESGSRGERVGVRVTWLSLDESDNDPRRFLDYLLAALCQIQTDVGRVVEAMLQSPQPPPDEVILTALVNEITTLAQPFILVLDDYHVIHTSSIHQKMNFLLEHQPPPMQLVILTREDAPLPLPRLRVRGQLTEIRQNDLRFTQQECAEFLNRVMGLDLTTEDITALERRTEGWIAGLQLAALSMRGRNDLSSFIEAFTGSSHFILDYLIEEVFNQQSRDVQEFLLKTSVLERLSGPLCDAVTGRRDGRSLLEKIERANLFIVPLDQSRAWYRYHRLFADLLRQRLQTSGNISETELHRLASQWLQKEGFLPEAIQHALSAHDWEIAANLIGDQSTVILRRGELITLLGWFKSLPEETIRSRPNLCRHYGWGLMLTGQLDAAAPYLDCAERLSKEDDMQLGQIMVAQAYLARVRGDYPLAITLSKQTLELVSENDLLHRGLVLFTLGFSLFSAGHITEAEPVLVDACETARASGNDFARMTALSLLAAIQKNKGRLRRAAEFCQQVLNEAHGSPVAAHSQVFLASVLYEWNELGAASDELGQALKASQQMGNLAIQPEIYRMLTHVHLVKGNLSSALKLVDDFQQTFQTIDSPSARAMLAALRADVALTQGDILSATYWVEQMTVGIDPSSLGILYGLTQARLFLAEGKCAEASKILVEVYDTVARMGLVAVMIEVRAWQALTAESPNEALRFLGEALKMAQPEGFIRTFVDLCAPMKFLLERLRAEGGELKYYVLRLLFAFGEKTAQGSRDQPLVEAMSERELEILHLMADGLSNHEIAQKLVITVGTTKSHVHHIREKIGSDSRMHAVAKARELGLV